MSETPTELKKAIIKKFKRENNLEFSTDQITVGTGGKQVLYNAFMATLNKGDEVIIPAPFWVSYPDMVLLAGGKPKIIKCTEQEGLKLTPKKLKKAISKKTKWIILNSPSNPTGAGYSKKEINDLAKILTRYKKIFILSDDIYEKIMFDQKPFVSLANVAPDLIERTVIVNGVSKSHAMTGWRIGFTAAPLQIAKAIGAIQSHSTSNPTSFAQVGAVAALDGPQDHLDEWLGEFSKRRTFACERLNSINGLSCINSEGAFYLFPKVSDTGMQSGEFCERLLSEAKVAAVPGVAFGSDDYMRISYATSMDNIEQALDRLEQFVNSL